MGSRRVPGLVLAAAIAASLVLAPTASAQLISGNLLTNPGAETGTAATNEVSTPCPDGWTCSAAGTGPSFVRYGVTTFPSLAESARIAGGQNFFTGGRADDTIATQLLPAVDDAVTAEQAAGRDVYMTVSGCFGGWQSDGDNARLRLAAYTNFQGNVLRFDIAGTNPVTPTDRQNETRLVQSFAIGGVPTNMQLFAAEIAFDRQNGVYNDGYADNLSIEMSNSPAGTPPVDCDSSNDGGSGGGGGGTGGGGGDGGGSGGGDGGGGDGNGQAAGAAGTLGFARKATILERKERLRTKLTCNTDRVERCQGTLSATVVKSGQSAPTTKPVAIGTYSVASLGTAKAKLDLTAKGARKLAKLSDAKLARRAVVLSATTELGAEDASDSATLALKRKR